MSKIGRKPIELTTAKATVDGKRITIQGPKLKVEHELPEGIALSINEKILQLSLTEDTRKNKALWGLHRALIANKVRGVEKGFEQKVNIIGLGYKAVASGQKMTFTLGYSHKIDYNLPEGVSVNIDKSGQKLVFSSSDKFLLGNVCDKVRSLRKPEPYKGTGILRENDVIIRKAGKTKSA